MKIIFLGTNGWFTSETGNTPCVLIDSKDNYVIFDAGNGFYKLDKYITENKPISLFISHFHLDHTNGLHTLAKFNFPQGIDVYVAEGRKKDFDDLIRPPYTIGYIPSENNIKNLATEVRVHELKDGDNIIGLPVTIKKLFHAYDDHGFRVVLEDKAIVYTGDTSLIQEDKALSHNADLLIHECSYRNPKAEDKWGHVDATEAAQLAKEMGVKQLALTHFDPLGYPNLESRDEASRKAKAIFENTITAKDDLIIEI